jgi:hypothetical protein
MTLVSAGIRSRYRMEGLSWRWEHSKGRHDLEEPEILVLAYSYAALSSSSWERTERIIFKHLR